MSQIKLQSNASGSGVLTIAAPNTNSTRTLNLPDADGTIGVVASLTANGVMYVNGSSQPTSGSSLVFDGTNLGLGVTPSAWSGFTALQIQNGALFTDSTSFRSIMNGYYNGTNWIYSTSNAATRYEQLSGIHRWFNAPSGTAGFPITFTQAMTLDASGNLGVGTTSPARRLSVLGGSGDNVPLRVTAGAGSIDCYIDFKDPTTTADYKVRVGSYGDALVFYAGGSERARIDSSGNLLVGATSGSTNVFRNNRNNDQVAYFQNENTSNPFGLYISYTSAAPNSTGSWFISCRDSGTNRMQVYSNGGIANYSGNNVNLSDRREKTNFAPAKSYLETICAIPVQTFNYIDQNLEEDDGLTLGVVAQDVQAVAPELVMESNWGSNDEPKMRLSIYQTDLQYALMKCIQELKADLDATKAELAALKGI